MHLSFSSLYFNFFVWGGGRRGERGGGGVGGPFLEVLWPSELLCHLRGK